MFTYYNNKVDIEWSTVSNFSLSSTELLNSLMFLLCVVGKVPNKSVKAKGSLSS